VTADYIPFNRPYSTGKEMIYAAEAQGSHHLSGDGAFTKRCHQWIEERTGCARALLTHSCTSALDMAALLLDIKSGDEVIVPSYTFVSRAARPAGARGWGRAGATRPQRAVRTP
jgi:dTDP-4-amino-4,6-dideoxygalactose transaminase